MRQSRKKWERKREEQRNKVIAVLFIVMMVIFCVVNIATADREFSAKENRALEQRPKLTISGIESGRWMNQYESYVSDQFAGRDFWVALKSRIDLIAGKRKANGVFKGKDHYLLEDIARPDEEQLKANLDAMKKFQETYKDIPMYMMLVPNAANIESDKLPYCTVSENKGFAWDSFSVGKCGRYIEKAQSRRDILPYGSSLDDAWCLLWISGAGCGYETGYIESTGYEILCSDEFI